MISGNFLSQILGQANAMEPSFMRPSAPMGGTQPGSMGGPSLADIERKAGVPPQRQRASVVDILGAFADTFAELGGEKPQYQSGIDARNERARQAEEDQMARELYPIKKQQAVLGNQKTQQELMYDQNEVLGQAASYVQRAYANGGVEGARNVFQAIGPRIMTPEQLQGEMAQFDANPEGYVNALSVFTGGGKDAEYGTTVYYDKDEKGNVYPYQVSKSGGKQYLNMPEGRTPAPPLLISNTGLGYTPISRQTGLRGGPEIPMTGDITQGITLSQPEGGGPPVAAPIEGGKQDVEFTKDVRDLQTLDNALASFEDVFPEVRGNIDAMAAAGSLSGIPADAVDANGVPLQGGSNLGAIAMQNVPLLEQATNEEGFSAREQIRSAGRVMVQQLGPLLVQAQNSGANLTSRMMDTPKELDGLLEQVINTKDYKTALTNFNRFKTRYNEVRREVQGKIAAAQQKTAKGRQAAPAQPSGPVRIRYDAQGNRIQ